MSLNSNTIYKVVAKVITKFTLLVWLIVGLYFGIAGLAKAKYDENIQEIENKKEKLMKESVDYKLDDLTFSNKYELLHYIEDKNVSKYFLWAQEISSFLSLILTSFFFGILGSISSIFKEIVYDNVNISDIKIWSKPLLGGLTGLVIFGLSYILPEILVNNSGSMKPITLMFLSMFGGMFTKEFQDKLSLYFNKVFL